MNRKFVFLFVICFFMCGCGSSTLTCQKTVDSSGVSSLSLVSIVFRNDSPTKVNIKTSISSSNTSSTMVSAMESALKKYENKRGVETKINSSGDKLESLIQIDFNKVNDSDKQSLGFYNISSIEVAKSFYKDQGFVCE